MELTEFIMAIGIIIMVGSWLPQAIKILKNKSSRDVSIEFLIAIIIGTTCLIPHSYVIGDTYFLFLNTSATIMEIIVLILSLKYKNQS